MRNPRLLLTAALLAVSTSAIFARYLPAVPAVAIGFWRMMFAGLLLWGFSAVRPQGRLTKNSYGLILVAGIFLGFHFACFFGALKHTTIAAATFLSTTAPIFTVIAERVFLKRRWERQIFLGVVVALIGALIIQIPALNGLSGKGLGNALGILASICMAVVLMLSETIRRRESAFVYSRSMYMIAGLTLLPMVLMKGFPVFQLSAAEFGWLFLLGLIPTVIGHTSFYYALKWLSPTVVASVPLGEPILASIWAWLLFTETPPLVTVAGGCLILGGLFLITSRKPSRSEFQNDML